LADWSDNSWLKDLQKQTLAGQIPDVCLVCKQSEEDFGESLRTSSLRDYGGKVFTETNIDFIDYRSINICNFKCRSCDPIFSHGIDNETKNNPALLKFWTPNQTKTVSVDSVNRDWISENIRDIRRLMFTGGEPTCIPEIKSLIGEIASQELDIDVMITTNGSFEDPFWKEIVQKISRMHWTISIDAVGDLAEIVRQGTNWSIVDANARWLAKHAHSLDINTVVSDISVPGLPDLFRYVRDLQKISNGYNGCYHQLHVCRTPSATAADNWPPDLKPKILDLLRSCLLDLTDYQQEFLKNFCAIIEKSNFDDKSWNRSREFHDTLDAIRDQNHRILFDI
jgi:sulfatase maturation enzyme AslB (radical SAM superfamily)